MKSTSTKIDRDNENFEYCKRIAEELDDITDGNIYRCPHCGEFIKWDDEQFNEEEALYTCTESGEEFDENELEPVTMWDKFNDVLDIEYRVNQNKEYKSVRLMVTCGGPNIYIDTAEKAVLLYWWTDSARYNLRDDTVDLINEVFEELYNI